MDIVRSGPGRGARAVEQIIRSKRREKRPNREAVGFRMQAQTAARFEDILAHVTFTVAGSRDSRTAVCLSAQRAGEDRSGAGE